MMKLLNSRITVPAITLLSLYICTFQSAAQESGSVADTEIEEIITIGTRSQTRAVEDSLVPVDIITADDLLRSPNIAGELGGLLQAAVASFSMPRQSNSGYTDIIRSAQLRGLSPDQVLVLVNGKRRHVNSVISTESKVGRGSAAVDFNNIPTSAIERIEVLRDGAAAQYGSDAIAGVINIVLKDNAEGGNISVSYGGHITDLEPVDKSITDGETVTVSANHGFSSGNGFINLSLEYRDRSSTNRSSFDQLPTIGFAEFIAPIPSSGTPEAAPNDALAGMRNYREGDGEASDINLMYNAGLDLDSGFELYSFGSYSERDGEGYNFFRYPVSANNVISVYPNGFLPISEADVTDFSVAGGITGELSGGWLIDASVVHGFNEFSDGVKNTLNSSLGEASPTEFYRGEYEYSQTVLNFDVSRGMELGAIPVNAAAGLEFRFEDYSTKAGDPESYIAGTAVACTVCITFGNSDVSKIGAQSGPGLTPDDEVDEDRFSWSAYIDLEFDITEDLLFSVAGRFEDYDDFGDTVNGKAAARYELFPGFAVRGSVSTGFRAPSLAQAFFTGTTTSYGTGGALVRTLSLPVTDPIAQENGAEALDAEESLSMSVGFTWSHDSGLSLTFDYFEVEIDDRIALSQNIPVGGVPGVGGVRFFTNVADTETTGFDVVASYRHEGWNLSVAYNNIDTDIVNNPNRVIMGIEEQNTYETAPPEDKLILTGSWSNETISALVRATRFGETERIFDFGGGFEPQQVYGAEWSVDADIEYAINDNWSISAGGNNLLDEYPDLSIFDISYFGNLPYDVLSPIGVNGRFVYVRTSFSY
ncbi:MAG: TonB-dependent receptor [Gammaproteobacteria bacterium]|nr:TonB-dependent receptor [Gammaproteobacteria bacterium]